MADTLCWSCKNCIDGCSWSKKFKPVKGWKADKTYIPSDGSISYMVHECPKYKLDKLIMSPELVSRLTGINVRQIYRLPHKQVIGKLLKLGYEAISDSEGQFILVKAPKGFAGPKSIGGK